MERLSRAASGSVRTRMRQSFERYRCIGDVAALALGLAVVAIGIDLILALLSRLFD